MQALILDDDLDSRSGLAKALARKGFEVTAMADADAAKRHAREAIVDVLVLAERVGGRLSHDLALLAEWRNPLLGAVLMTDREGPEVEELHALIPSLRAIVARDTAPADLARLAVDAVAAQARETAEARLDRLWAEAEAASEGEEPTGEEPAERPAEVVNIFAVLPSRTRTRRALPPLQRGPAPLILFNPVSVPAARRPVERSLQVELV